MHLLAIVAVAASGLLAQPESQTEREIRQHIRDAYAYGNQNNRDMPGTISKHGSLEFFSSGGLLQEIEDETIVEWDEMNIQPKHMRVAVLVEDQAAVAQFYAEGTMKPMGGAAVPHYLTRVTIVFVKEDGSWRTRAAHYSPVTGGAGTSQPVLDQDDT